VIFGLKPGDYVRFKRGHIVTWSYVPQDEGNDMGIVIAVLQNETTAQVLWSRDERISTHDVAELERM
jgi:hypothetical protein